MILFWLICAVLVAIALAFVIPPLLQTAEASSPMNDGESNVAVYRDQLSELEADLRNGIISDEQYQRDKEEIERRLLEDVSQSSSAKSEGPAASKSRSLVYAIALGIPLIATGLYLRVGNPAAFSAPGGLMPAAREAPPGENSSAEGGMSQQRIEANVAALAKRLQENPQDAAGWIMLGRSYVAMEKYREASEAYARAAALKPNDADVLADYAFALAMANGRRLQGQPNELIKKALALDSENPKVIELAGSAAFEAKNYKEAIDYWEKLRARSVQDAELTQKLTERIDRAKSLDRGSR